MLGRDDEKLLKKHLKFVLKLWKKITMKYQKLTTKDEKCVIDMTDVLT